MRTKSVDRSNRPGDLTQVDCGQLPISAALEIPGANNEHLLFARNQCGRMTCTEFDDLTRSISEHGVLEPILVIVESSGLAQIYEGNHRLRASIAAGLSTIPAEVRYFGNAQDNFLIP